LFHHIGVHFHIIIIIILKPQFLLSTLAGQWGWLGRFRHAIIRAMDKGGHARRLFLAMLERVHVEAHRVHLAIRNDFTIIYRISYEISQERKWRKLFDSCFFPPIFLSLALFISHT
jgi:hypothetical protein